MVSVVVFEDFECPACRAFSLTALAGAREGYGDVVRFGFWHYPLPYHSFALRAAAAAECAALQGDFWRMHDQLYLWQDSLGLVDLNDFAAAAGVRDLGRFDECVASGRGEQVVLSEQQETSVQGISGTPSIVIDGKLLGWVPDSIEFSRMLDSVLSSASARR